MTWRTVLLATCVAGGWVMCAPVAKASGNDILIGLDSKVEYGVPGQHNVKPGDDAILVVDISNPLKPHVRASLPLTNSLLGPPTNLQITPDGHLGLVANSVTNVQDGTNWKAVPDDKLYVLDLQATPPKLADTVTVGKQPSGLAITRKGDLALVANRAGKSVSVLSIDGKTVKPVAEIPMGNEVAAVAITPDGKRAFAVMNTVNKVGVLTVDGTTVTYDKAFDIPASTNPYNVDITPDGRFAIVSATGAGGNNGDALTVINTTGPHPHVVGLMTAGRGAEGLAISPNGKWAVVPLLQGSSDKPSDWSFTKNGAAVLLSIGAHGELHEVNRLPLGGLPEGLAFSPDSQYVFIGNYIDKNMQVFRIVNGKLTDTKVVMTLPQQPASIRGLAR